MLEDNAVFQKCPDVVLRHVAGEALLIPIRKKLSDMDRIFTLNETGVVVWDLLDGQRPLSELVRAMVERFDVTESVARQDVAELVAQFVDAGLVERVG